MIIIYSIVKFAIQCFSTVDSSISVTIQPVVTGNMVEITVLVNVRRNYSLYIHNDISLS